MLQFPDEPVNLEIAARTRKSRTLPTQAEKCLVGLRQPNWPWCWQGSSHVPTQHMVKLHGICIGNGHWELGSGGLWEIGKSMYSRPLDLVNHLVLAQKFTKPENLLNMAIYYIGSGNGWPCTSHIAKKSAKTAMCSTLHWAQNLPFFAMATFGQA